MKTSKKSVLLSIEPVEEKEYYVASPAQRRLFFRVHYNTYAMEASMVEEMMEEYVVILGKISEIPHISLEDLRQKKKKENFLKVNYSTL